MRKNNESRDNNRRNNDKGYNSENSGENSENRIVKNRSKAKGDNDDTNR